MPRQEVRFLPIAAKRGGSVSERDDGFLDNRSEEIKQGNSERGELFCSLVHVGVLCLGPDGGRLGGGVHHQCLDGFHVKKGFGRVGKGGILLS